MEFLYICHLIFFHVNILHNHDILVKIKTLTSVQH